MSNESNQINDLIRSGLSSGSIRTDGRWGAAPKISSNQKVTAPSAIRESHSSDAVQEITPVRGPSAKSVEEGARREAAERARLLQEEDDRKAAQAETTPEKTQARLAFLERTVSKLQAQVRKLEKKSDG